MKGIPFYMVGTGRFQELHLYNLSFLLIFGFAGSIQKYKKFSVFWQIT